MHMAYPCFCSLSLSFLCGRRHRHNSLSSVDLPVRPSIGRVPHPRLLPSFARSLFFPCRVSSVSVCPLRLSSVSGVATSQYRPITHAPFTHYSLQESVSHVATLRLTLLLYRPSILLDHSAPASMLEPYPERADPAVKAFFLSGQPSQLDP